MNWCLVRDSFDYTLVIDLSLSRVLVMFGCLLDGLATTFVYMRLNNLICERSEAQFTAEFRADAQICQAQKARAFHQLKI